MGVEVDHTQRRTHHMSREHVELMIRGPRTVRLPRRSIGGGRGAPLWLIEPRGVKS